MEYTTFLWLFGLCTTDVQATTHWMVTETGLVQPRADSPFEMARPYDLLAFLNQDTRWDNIKKLYNDLSKRQVDINKLWVSLELDTDMNSWMSRHPSCKESDPVNTLDWYAAHLEDGLSKHIPQEEYQLYNPAYGQDNEVPDCKKISSLTFSMFAFEHLEAMVNRENLSVSAELSLPELVSPLMTVEQFGHWVASVLRKNSSSWLHYNMASLYWRVRGNAPKALECSRRAVHYAPRKYKDIALLSLGTVFHRAKKPDDAIIVLGAAVDHDPQCAEAHFVLAHAYAVIGEFNESLKHYEQTLKLNSGYDQTVKYTHGVLCIQDFVKKMKEVHRKLLELKSEIAEYAEREALWLKSQAAFLRTMKHNEEMDYTNVEKIVTKMSDITGLNIKTLKKEGDKNSLIQYFLEGPLYNENWHTERGLMVVEAAASLQRLIRHIGKHANIASDFVMQPDLIKLSDDDKIRQEIGPLPVIPELAPSSTSDRTKVEPQPAEAPENKPPDDETYEYEFSLPLYPPTLRVSRTVEEFDTDPDWPSDRLCKQNMAFPESLELIYPMFMPFENKGLRLRGILTERIGVPVHGEHELPWHPPACPHNKEATASLKRGRKLHMMPEVAQTNYLRHKLLEYVGDGYPEQVTHMQDAEIGQRIYTAMQSNATPKWLVYTLASLYWRVRGNNVNALSCLLSASKHVRVKYKDVVMISLASVYLEMGYFEEALLAADEAFKISMYEPTVNFMLYQLNMIKKLRNTQQFHLKQTLRVEPTFLGGAARHLLVTWGCLLKHAGALTGFQFGEGDTCTEVEPGVSMVCNKGSRNCHIANVQCFTHSERDSTSTLLRLMEMRDEAEQPEPVDASVFEPFITRMPLERSDKEGHADNMANMLDIFDRLNGCGPRGCSNIKPEDLSLKEEDCSYQYLQLGYWLHVISFRQLITEFDLRFPPEMQSLPPSTKKVPECRTYSDPSQDFFLERLSRVDTEGWEHDLSLMHQLTDLYDQQDFTPLGAKLAKYIETRGRVWLGALAAGWWCGADGRGACAVRCLSAAYALAPTHLKQHALVSLAALLHMQGKRKEARDIAYLTFYLSPKSKTDAFLVAVSNTYLAQYEQAVWMYRYALTFDDKYLPAKACLHATMCIMLFGKEKTKPADLREDL